MTAAKLQLRGFRLGELVLVFNDKWLDEDAHAENESYELDVATELLGTEEHPDSFLARLSIACTPNRATEGEQRFERVEMTLWGIFDIDPDLSEEIRSSLLSFNTFTILHGIARGMLISATGGCLDGPFILPSVNFVEYMQQRADADGDEVDDE